MTWHKVEIEVMDILGTGKCGLGQKIGDKYIYPDDRGKICPTAVHTLYPFIMGLQAGGNFPWDKNPGESILCCPEYQHPVVYRITRIESSE